MDVLGHCKVIRVYVDEGLKWEGELLYKAIVNRLLKEKVSAGATVFRGVEGFGSSSHLHTPRIIEIAENLPFMIEVVDKPDRALKALNLIEEMLPNHCLVTVHDTHVLHYHSADGKHTKTKSWK
jgi:PII-like signaling protein